MNDWQWSPTLISFDADPAHTTRSTSHHIIRLFSNNKLSHTLSSTDTNTTVTHGTHNSTFNPLFHVTGLASNDNDFVFKGAVYNTTSAVAVSLKFPGVKAGDKAQLIMLTSPPGPNASNEVGGKNVVKRAANVVYAAAGGAFEFTMEEWSVAVLRTVNVAAKSFVTL
jgi:alpha-N-arabinofuranosidase